MITWFRDTIGKGFILMGIFTLTHKGKVEFLTYIIEMIMEEVEKVQKGKDTNEFKQ